MCPLPDSKPQAATATGDVELADLPALVEPHCLVLILRPGAPQCTEQVVQADHAIQLYRCDIAADSVTDSLCSAYWADRVGQGVRKNKTRKHAYLIHR
ncbi:unnamed protein product [Protopolystoma xenopodis]|uniref:Uncharacterized protein n=1 Tax=Protopolystoma xenopodis TaxID=117903 RepID=A0A3S5BXB4_9PLAT|nr:unnamed protein product [Protopolystoma xenopodis]